MDPRTDIFGMEQGEFSVTKPRARWRRQKRLWQLALMRLGSSGRRWCLAILAACILGEAFAILESMVRTETIAPSFIVLAFVVLVLLRIIAIASAAAILVNYWRPVTPSASEPS